MPRPQFTLRALLVAMLVVAAFLGGLQFGQRREKQRRRLQEEGELAEYGQEGATIHISYSYPDKPKDGAVRPINRIIHRLAPRED